MSSTEAKPKTRTFSEFAKQADYSLMDSLEADPQATDDGDDHLTREVFSGHYVPVTPTAISKPEYVTHSKTLFNELGLSQELALDELFRRLFSGDISVATAPMRPVGWATGYALSIYGTEYTQQCPFGTGNGYGDGRAISVLKVYSMAKDGRCNLREEGLHHTAEELTDEQCYVQVFVSFWRRIICSHLEYQHHDLSHYMPLDLKQSAGLGIQKTQIQSIQTYW